jgi:hypothetical protein
VKEAKHAASDARRARPAASLAIGGAIIIIVLAASAWAIFGHRSGAGAKPELVTYQLCVGREQKACPDGTTFVRNEGEDTVSRWAQKECARYKTRRIVVNDGPTKDCDCYVADVSCASE